MSIRSLGVVVAIIAGLGAAAGQAQQAVEKPAALTSASVSDTSRPNASREDFPSRDELLRRIGVYEAAERDAEAGHAGNVSLAKIASDLAAVYEDLGMYPRAEERMRRAISLLRDGPDDKLAAAIGYMAVLHAAMGEEGEAEKDDMNALEVRERVGEPLGIALTQSDLAGIYIRQKKYTKALDYAQRAIQIAGDNAKADVQDRIAVRQTMAYALCGVGRCGEAMPILKDAIELAKSSYGEDSLFVGAGYYLLGHAAWQSGDMADAAAWMQRGTERMMAVLGGQHAVYLNAMGEYARFLRERGRVEEASAAEREVKMARSVVDVRAMSVAAEGLR